MGNFSDILAISAASGLHSRRCSAVRTADVADGNRLRLNDGASAKGAGDSPGDMVSGFCDRDGEAVDDLNR